MYTEGRFNYNMKWHEKTKVIALRLYSILEWFSYSKSKDKTQRCSEVLFKFQLYSLSDWQINRTVNCKVYCFSYQGLSRSNQGQNVMTIACIQTIAVQMYATFMVTTYKLK